MERLLEYIPFLMTIHSGKHKLNYVRLAEMIMAISGLVFYLQYVAVPQLETKIDNMERRYTEKFIALENKIDKISNDIYEPKFERKK